MSLYKLNFQNTFLKDLPVDPEKENYTRQVERACSSKVSPIHTSAPKLIAYSLEMAEELGLSQKDIESELFTQVFTGNKQLEGMEPYAMCYGGHQFGSWAGQLGDGRAINLGEILSPKNERWVLQLKGAGPTPYSRKADGLAVLRSSVREYLCSEAMHHLGIPTTRALSLALSGDEVLRDMFYDGNAQYEKGAIVCRTSPSFIRFGNFQIFTARKDYENLERLLNYTILTDFPYLGKPSREVYIRFLEEVCDKTVEMVIHWMRVGFVHGVMNTDNMSVLGLTIDYGPYGWLEDYNPNWTPNTTDKDGRRYCFGRQASISHWNCVQLANAIVPLIGDTTELQPMLDSYPKKYEKAYLTMMRSKLGLMDPNEDDQELINSLEKVLQLTETDMTIFFRSLAELKIDQKIDLGFLKNAYYLSHELTDDINEQTLKWLDSYQNRLKKENKIDQERKDYMNAINPKYVLRNYLAQEAISKADQGDYSLINKTLEVMRKPYSEQHENESFAAKRPEWARTKAGCSMLSCSS